jgi:DNA-binding CsgD family transcriptional regulator
MKIFYVFVLLIISLQSFAQYDSVSKLSYPEKFQAISNLFAPYWSDHHLDTVAFDKVSNALLHHADKDAKETKWMLLQISLIRFAPLFGGKDSARSFYIVDSLLKKAAALNFLQLQAVLHLRKAWIYEHHHNYTPSIQEYLWYYDLRKKLQRNAIPYNDNYIMYSMALRYYKFKDYETAIKYALESYNDKDPLWIKQLTTNLIGLIYLKSNKIDSSKYWFQKSLDIALDALGPSKIWQGIVKGNMAYCWYEEGNYSKAKPLLEEAIAITTTEKVWDNVSSFASTLADIYIKEGNATGALAMLNTSKNACYINGDLNCYIKLHTGLANYYKKIGNAQQALFHQDSMLHYEKIFTKEFDINLKIKGELANDIARRKEEEIANKAEMNKQKLLRYSLMGALLLAMVIAILMYNRQRLRHKVKQQQLENNAIKAHEELSVANAQLEDFTQHLKEKNELIERFTIEIENLQTTSKNTLTEQQLHILETLRNAAILTDDDWEHFRRMFEKAHPGFFIRLREKFDNISQAETRFMALSKLKLTNKEMAGMLGVSTDAIRSIKSRLKKKLYLSEDTDFEFLAAEV